jgi:hypothetical protein
MSRNIILILYSILLRRICCLLSRSVQLLARLQEGVGEWSKTGLVVLKYVQEKKGCEN